jgi:hypothetical protein
MKGVLFSQAAWMISRINLTCAISRSQKASNNPIAQAMKAAYRASWTSLRHQIQNANWKARKSDLRYSRAGL